nr:hypothetical protein [Ralstonia sp.]
AQKFDLGDLRESPQERRVAFLRGGTRRNLERDLDTFTAQDNLAKVVQRPSIDPLVHEDALL